MLRWIVLLGIVFAYGQNSADVVLKQIELAIRQGDAASVARFFNSRVELSINHREGDYSKQQAQFILKEFFTNYPVRSFVFMHKGTSGNVYYAIGNYVSTRGTFDVNLFLKKNHHTFFIEQLRFEQAR